MGPRRCCSAEADHQGGGERGAGSLFLVTVGFRMMENMTNMTTPAANPGFEKSSIYKSIDTMSVVIYSLVCALGVLGNGVVIWATGFRMKKTVSTVWYLNLAVADFLVTAFLPLQITYMALHSHWPFGWFMCKMKDMIFYVNMFASVFTLAVISVDRCVCVVCPVWARCSGYRTVRKASWVSLGVWVLALALSTPYFIFKDTRDRHDKVQCFNNYALAADYSNLTPEEEQLHEFRMGAMFIARFVLGFVVPSSVIVSCYCVIIYRLRNRPLAGQSGRSFKIIGTVIAAFFLCWLPYHIIRLVFVATYYYRDKHSETLFRTLMFGRHITTTLALLNSCLNPLLYVFSQGFKDMFRRNVLKVLQKAFAEETSQTNTLTDPDVGLQMMALSEREGNTGPPRTQDPSGDCPV